MIFKYMNRTNRDHLNSEEIDIIKKHEKKEEKMFIYIIFFVVVEQLINAWLGKGILSSIISIAMSLMIVAAMGYYFWFKKTKYKRIEKEISEIKNKE